MTENAQKSIDKVVVLGAQGVGKTSLVVRYVSDHFYQHASPTIGASFFTYRLVIDGFKVNLQVWDTAGQERFRSMAPMYYRRANAALLVFDLTSIESFEDMKRWVHELTSNVEDLNVLYVVGNKSDLAEQRRVSSNLAREFALSVEAHYFETSALENKGVEDVFYQLASNLVLVHETEPRLGAAPDLDTITASQMYGYPAMMESASNASLERIKLSSCC